MSKQGISQDGGQDASRLGGDDSALATDGGRTLLRTGSHFEQLASYSRAVRAGGRILVSGTADLGPDGRARHPGDAYSQTFEAIRHALDAIAELGGRTRDVVRTRIFLAAGADWQAAVKAHGEHFNGVHPANTTLFVEGFIPEGALVEVEVEADLSLDDFHGEVK